MREQARDDAWASEVLHLSGVYTGIGGVGGRRLARSRGVSDSLKGGAA